jgi:putative ABC transport system permease protein
MTDSFTIAGRPPAREEESPTAEIEIVSPDYFRAMSIPLLRGRYFTDHDAEGAPGVAIISQALARRYWPQGNPEGNRVHMDWEGDREIVGVVGDTRDIALATEPKPQLYLCYLQFVNFGSMTLLVRTTSNPLEAVPAVRSAVWAVDKDQPLADVMTLERVLSRSVAPPRFRAVLVATFAGLGFVLALVGIYGVMSYIFTQRTHEIGVRVALGAERKDVLKLLVGHGFILTLIGLAAGFVVALGLTRFLASFLYGVRPTDPITFAVVCTVFTGAALLSSYVPARRATKVDPMVALRYE